jgi:hypothetical protein
MFQKPVLFPSTYHIISYHIIYFPSVDPYRITKSKWIWNRHILGKTSSKTITKCTSITELSTIFKVSAQYKLVSMIRYYLLTFLLIQSKYRQRRAESSGPLQLSYSQSLGNIATANLRYATEDRSSPRVVTRKWLLKNEKLTRFKNKTWINPKIKNHKESHELRLIRPQTHHKYSEHTHLKFLTPLNPSVQKVLNLLHGFN